MDLNPRSYGCCFLLSLLIFYCYSQDISLYQQFNGRYDYLAIGNTMNVEENGPFTNCTILTSSSADLSLESDQVIQAAYLYWAGSGDGDFDVDLNGNTITAERTFSDALDATRVFFAAFADITDLIIAEGNGTYTLSDLDLTAVITTYCPTGTNFAGWAITVIYEDLDLPLNQVNVYDGLQSVPTELTIVLDNLNVLDNEGAKIGFVAWEGDAALAVSESLTINGNVIGNPPLNPVNNAFNGTNSFTNETNLFNMDIDVYDIQNNIAIGDTSATIQLTSGQDFVMINNIITVLNSQLPDATITIDNYVIACNSNQVLLDYTVYNTNSTDVLPIQTPIAFYIDSNLIMQSATQTELPIGGSESGSIAITIPEMVGDSFQIVVVVDDDGSGTGTVTEINEDNNMSGVAIDLISSSPIITLPSLISCDLGFDRAIFDLQAHVSTIDPSFDTSQASFFESIEDAETGTHEILNPSQYQNISQPQSIFIRIENTPCYQLFQFELLVENCPPIIPQGFSPNNDGYNDWFNIVGLYDVFELHQLRIYNRYGTLIFEGNNEKKWFGQANKGIANQGKLVPVGTYFYVLHLNDPQFSPITGWVYVNY